MTYIIEEIDNIITREARELPGLFQTFRINASINDRLKENNLFPDHGSVWFFN